MNLKISPKLAPIGMWAMGSLAFLARRCLYATAADATGLLPAGHPLRLVTALLIFSALILAGLCSYGLDGSNAYGDNFPAGVGPLAGSAVGAAAIWLTVWINPPLLPGRIGLLWKLLGYLSPVCLGLAGVCRFRGRKPHFLLYAAVCAFFAFHLIDHYQLWCSNPQLQDYLFALLGTVALCFFSYQLTAFSVGRGSRKKLLFWGLLAQFLCLGELACTQNLYLYAGCFLWVTASMCVLVPESKEESGV